MTFNLVAAGIWGLGTLLIVFINRQKKPEFDPKFDVAKEVIETLKDDLSPKRTLVGWLDLTGFKQKSKELRRKKSVSGRPIVYYRDEWLRFKMNLYDGNVLRVTAMNKVKDREGFYKRSSSGKMKWKTGSTHPESMLNISVSINPERYQGDASLPADFQAIPHTSFSVRHAEVGNGRIVVKLHTAKPIVPASEMLQALLFSYRLIPSSETTGGNV